MHVYQLNFFNRGQSKMYSYTHLFAFIYVYVYFFFEKNDKSQRARPLQLHQDLSSFICIQVACLRSLYFSSLGCFISIRFVSQETEICRTYSITTYFSSHCALLSIPFPRISTDSPFLSRFCKGTVLTKR